MSRTLVHRILALAVSVVSAFALAPLSTAPASASGINGPVLIGDPLLGALVGERFGFSLALDSSGSVLAVGSSHAQSTRGEVRVYVETGGVWVQRGATLQGEAGGDYFGLSVALSADGTVLAVGAPFNAAGGTDRGHVRVFGWSGSSWVQRGADIDGVSNYETSGGSIDLSADGTRVVIGAGLNGGGMTPSGAVRVFDWNGTSWAIVGSAIAGASGDQLGSSVAISGDGATLIAGGPGSTNGVARVYGFSGGAWSQVGSDIVGSASGDQFGETVDMDQTGEIIAVGSPRNDSGGSDAGAVAVYALTGGSWVQRGSTITGTAASARWGESIALSADASTLIAGAPIANSSAGYAQAYRFAEGSWSAYGDVVTGSAASDEAGFSVAISNSPLRVAVGAPLHDSPATNAGQVRVWEFLSPPAPAAGVGLPGIALHVAGPAGRQVEGSPVYVAAYKVKPGSSYTLVLRSEGSGVVTTLLQGAVDSRGHLMEKVILPALASGSYTVTMRGVHASGTGLQLVALIRVGPGGELTYLGDNTPGIW